MNITGGIILYAVTWFMVFFMVLPIRFTSQSEAGEVVPGTPKSAPSDYIVGKKAKITTLVSLAVFSVLYLIITMGNFTIADVDVFGLWKNRF